MHLLHLSDLHLPFLPRPWPLRQWFGKRTLGGANLVLTRWRHFRGGLTRLRALTDYARSADLDGVLFTGDATSLGTWREMRTARRAMEPLLAHFGARALCIPGNHDVYVEDAAREARFERCFGDHMLGDDHTEHALLGEGGEAATAPSWPIVRRLAPGVTVVAINSCRPNPSWKLSSGHVAPEQLRDLAALAAQPEVASGLVLVASHYGPYLENGHPDLPSHGLDNADELLEVLRGFPRAVLLHGHIHRGYRLREGEDGPWIVNAGSATFAGRESCWRLDIDGTDVAVAQGRWRGSEWIFDAPEPLRF